MLIKYFKKYLPLQLAFLLGLLLANISFMVYAHGGNTNLIHGCVGTGALNNGRLRVVGANENCAGNETPLHWSKYPATGGFFTDQLVNYGSSNENFSYRSFNNVSFTDSSWSNTNMDNAIFSFSNFTNAFVSEASALNTKFNNTNFTNATFRNGGFVNADFTNANFNGTRFLSEVGQIEIQNVIFTNANFTNADLSGTDFSSSTRNGAIWSNTTCPDGTNSNDNGNTCEGHLTP